MRRQKEPPKPSPCPVYVTYTKGDHAIPAGWYWERGRDIAGPFSTEAEAKAAAPEAK